jgi:hypothetical protein
VFPDVEARRISQISAHEVGKVVSRTHRPSLLPRIFPCNLFVLEAELISGPQAVGKIKSLENQNVPIRNTTRKILGAAQCFSKLRLGVYPNPFTPILISCSYIRFVLLGRNFPSVFLTKFCKHSFLPLGCNLPRVSHPV